MSILHIHVAHQSMISLSDLLADVLFRSGCHDVPEPLMIFGIATIKKHILRPCCYKNNHDIRRWNLYIYIDCKWKQMQRRGFKWITIHPRKLTWIPKMAIFKRNHLFQTIILGIHVSFRGCRHFSMFFSLMQTNCASSFQVLRLLDLGRVAWIAPNAEARRSTKDPTEDIEGHLKDRDVFSTEDIIMICYDRCFDHHPYFLLSSKSLTSSSSSSSSSSEFTQKHPVFVYLSPPTLVFHRPTSEEKITQTDRSGGLRRTQQGGIIFRWICYYRRAPNLGNREGIQLRTIMKKQWHYLL